MAFVRPVYFLNDGSVRAMNDTQIIAVRDACINLYLANISVVLSVVGSGGNLGTLVDTYLQHAATASLPVINAYYSRLEQTVYAIGDPGSSDLPLYLTAANDLRVMSLQDFIDTFMPDIYAFNPYTIHADTSLGGYSLVSGTPVFSDTRAVADTATSYVTVANYYLFRKNAGAVPALVPMAFSNPTYGFAFKSAAVINSHLLNMVRFILYAVGGYRIRYNMSGSGAVLGSGMTDTRLNSYIKRVTGVYPYQVTTYRPYGSAVTINTYYLRGTVT